MQLVRSQPTAFPSPALAQQDVFDRSRYFLRQKHFSLQEKYFVWDERGQKLMFVERPRHHMRSLLAIGGAIVACLLGVVVGIALTAAIAAALGLPDTIKTLLSVVSMFLGLGAALVTGVALSAKRHVTFYRDESKREPLLVVEQDRKFQLLSATYTVKDRVGNVLARLSKNYLYDVFRKQWDCDDANGRQLCVVKEDSILKSVLRRLFGPMLGVLRTNFVFLCGDVQIGKFDRQLTLFDRYVLDMTQDVQVALDRRVALAIGVMLDTGERR